MFDILVIYLRVNCCAEVSFIYTWSSTLTLTNLLQGSLEARIRSRGHLLLPYVRTPPRHRRIGWKSNLFLGILVASPTLSPHTSPHLPSTKFFRVVIKNLWMYAHVALFLYIIVISTFLHISGIFFWSFIVFNTCNSGFSIPSPDLFKISVYIP